MNMFEDFIGYQGLQYWMSQYGKKIHFKRVDVRKKAKSLKIYYCRI